jgi:DNA-binding FadR family transcriptional regulator
MVIPLSQQDHPVDPAYSFTPVAKRRLYEDIIDQIKEAIVEGKLKPGDPVPSERKLAKMFNVGRPTIREALRTLGLIGLIQGDIGRKGTRINDCSIHVYMDTIREQMSWLVNVDEKTIQNLWEVRYFVELGIAYSAANNATEEDLRKLDELIGKMKASLDDVEGYLRYALEFHETLALCTKNKIFYSIWRSFHDLVYKVHDPMMKSSGVPVKFLKANKILLEAIQSKNPEAINKAMKIHADVEKVFVFPKGQLKWVASAPAVPLLLNK